MKKEIKKIKQIKKITLKDVLNTIGKWSKYNSVSFIGSFVRFDNSVAEDRIIAYGDRSAIELHLKILNKEFKKDKKIFINW